MNKKWTQDEINFLQTNYGKMDINEMRVFLGDRTAANIRAKASSLKIKFRDWKNASALLSNDLITFYYIGLLLADGYFTNDSIIGIEMKIDDEDHVKKLISFLGFNSYYRCRATNFSNNYSSIIAQVSDKTNFPLIVKKFDIHQRKTKNPPDFSKYNFTDKQMLSLIIGFIDGDGSIYKMQNKSKISIQLCIDWADNLDFLNKFLHRYFRYPCKTNVTINSRNHASLYLTKSLMIKKMLKFAKINNLPIMMRKWNNVCEENIGQRSWE